MHSRGFVHTFELDAEHKLHIYAGSITEITADAIVSSDDNFLSAGGGVSAAIASAAGAGIRDVYRKILSKAKTTVGDVVRTSAGLLNAQHLYHAITIDSAKNQTMEEGGLRRLVQKIITAATSDGVRSLAMPALGTGTAFFEMGRAASVIISELVQSLAETPISNVILAVVDDDATRVFYEEALRAQADSAAVRALRRREESMRSGAEKDNRRSPKACCARDPEKSGAPNLASFLTRRLTPALTRQHQPLIWSGLV
jgi:O-acetyl-ADP-ribose deacetylase (regulator of RNase III)